ncbi:MAG TPA: thioesterase family protein [Mycobacteriales bacterium]
MTHFDRDTAVTRTGDDEYAATLSGDWWVFTGANGGYLAAVLLRAMTDRVGDPARMARSLTVHYLRPPAAGEVTIRTAVVREGRSVATLTATMLQEGREVVLAVAAFAKARPSMTFADAPMPPAPPVEETGPSRWPPELWPPIVHRFEYRPVTGDAMFGGEAEAAVSAWTRLREPRPVDPVLLALLADALAPAVFPKATGPVAATTIDLTVHFRAPAAEPPGDGWVLAAFRSRTGVDGYVEEDGEAGRPTGGSSRSPGSSRSSCRLREHRPPGSGIFSPRTTTSEWRNRQTR